jgi:hypothetical protein
MPEPPCPHHRLDSVRAAGPRPPVRLLRLVRAERAGYRADRARRHHLALGERDRHRRDHRSDERPLRKPQPHRQAGSPPGLRLPQPRQPAPPRPHRLHARHQAKDTTTASKDNTHRNRGAALSRFTSKAPYLACTCLSCAYMLPVFRLYLQRQRGVRGGTASILGAAPRARATVTRTIFVTRRPTRSVYRLPDQGT